MIALYWGVSLSSIGSGWGKREREMEQDGQEEAMTSTSSVVVVLCELSVGFSRLALGCGYRMERQDMWIEYLIYAEC